jgi:hypothetical protein
MGATLRSQIIAGKIRDRAYSKAGVSAFHEFESGFRRGRMLMCRNCLTGHRLICESEQCPCTCNDSDYKWAHKPSIDVGHLTSDHELAHVLMVRPELQELFR